MIYVARSKGPEMKVTHKVDFTGDTELQQLHCRSCGAQLSADAVEMHEGAIYVNGRLAHRRWHLVGQDWKRSFACDVTGIIRPVAENVVAIVGNDEYGMGGLWNPCALHLGDVN